MELDRPFDDGRWPDAEDAAECFVCGRAVDQRDPRRGTYALVPPDVRLKIHLGCIEGKKSADVELLYRIAVNDSVAHNRTLQ